MGTSHSSSDSTMMLWVMTVCVLGAAVAEAQDYTLCYDAGQDDGGICMQVEVDSKAETIHAHMMESEVFDDVETLEDYKVGLAASKVGSQEVCFVRGLKNSFDDTVAYLKTQQNGLLAQENDEGVELIAMPLDDSEEEAMSPALKKFCGDLPHYKLGLPEGTEEAPARRQVDVTFRRCVIFFFKYICYTTTLTIPTGSTITFLWIFG